MPNEIAYGFTGLQHIFGERINTLRTGVVYDAVNESLQYHNETINAMLAGLTYQTTLAQERFYLPSGGTLQPLDEWGNPKPTRPAGFYDVGYPMQGGGDAFGANRVSRQFLTVEDMNRATIGVLTKDADWLRRHIMASVLYSASWTFSDPEVGDVAVKPLANGDGDLYLGNGGALAADDHYLSQAADIGDAANPFPDIYSELMEHPSNTGDVIVYVAESLTATISGLAGFVPVGDPDVLQGSGSSTISGSIGTGYGDEVLGKADKCWIVLWRALPDDYMFAQATGTSPVAMRSYDSAALQGLFTEGFSPDGNVQESRWIRYNGFGVRDRTAALAYYIGNIAYQDPAAFVAPLAI